MLCVEIMAEPHSMWRIIFEILLIAWFLLRKKKQIQLRRFINARFMTAIGSTGGGGSRISQMGRQPKKGGGESIILRNILQNCMKMKKMRPSEVKNLWSWGLREGTSFLPIKLDPSLWVGYFFHATRRGVGPRPRCVYIEPSVHVDLLLFHVWDFLPRTTRPDATDRKYCYYRSVNKHHGIKYQSVSSALIVFGKLSGWLPASD